MAQLHSLFLASPTSFSPLEPHPLPRFLSPLFLSSLSHKPTSLSIRRSSSLNPICFSSSSSSSSSSSYSSTITIQNPFSESKEEIEISPTRLLAQNVPWTCTADDVRALFQNYGTVLDVELSMHNKTRSRGLAFVEMGSVEEASEALAKLEGYEFEGRTLRMCYAIPKRKKVSPPVRSKPAVLYNLFVANLPFAARAQDLMELFKSGGSEVASAEVIFNENPRRPSGYGFVSFKTKKEADEALTTFEGKELMGRSIRVARSKRFVKPESETNSQSEDGDDMPADSSHDSEQTETVDNL